MSILILTDEMAQTPIGDVLRSATDDVINVKDANGKFVAQICIRAPFVDPRALAQATADIEILRRRLSQDPALDITTAELLARARAATGE